MKRSTLAPTSLVALAVLVFVIGVSAGASLRRTKVTFSQSVRVPGMLLSAGTYYFSAPLPKNRALVKVQDENGKFVTQFMGLLDYSQKPPHDIIVFGDHECGPRAIKSWSFPPSGSAVRFVYSPEEAALIAATCNEPVPEVHESALNETQLDTYEVHLMTTQKQEVPYKTEALSASDQMDQNGFDGASSE